MHHKWLSELDAIIFQSSIVSPYFQFRFLSFLKASLWSQIWFFACLNLALLFVSGKNWIKQRNWQKLLLNERVLGFNYIYKDGYLQFIIKKFENEYDQKMNYAAKCQFRKLNLAYFVAYMALILNYCEGFECITVGAVVLVATMQLCWHVARHSFP